MDSRLVFYGQFPLPPGRQPMLGGKAAGLIELARLNHQVPPFYVISGEALRLTLDTAGKTEFVERAMQIASTGDRRELRRIAAEMARCLQQIALPNWLTDAIRCAHENTLLVDEFVAVRSSVVGEDAPGKSFAGIHESVLGLKGMDQIFDGLRQVWASAYAFRALSYRKSQRLPLNNIGVSVIVQQMINASRSGVMFTADPVTGKTNRVIVSCQRGLGQSLVSDPDTFRIDRISGAITAEVFEPSKKMELNLSGGVECVAVDNGQPNCASLNEDQLRELVEIGLSLERHFSRPQDIEFCFDAWGKLFLLQSRAIEKQAEDETTMGNHLIWDNSNIVESYSGVTSPMTFSFIRRAYAIVYHCFAEVMGISPRVVRGNRATFENMLGLFRGRVYYNLKNWYRTVHLFPGFNYNRRFMESMMGLKEPLELEDRASSPGFMRRWFVEFPELCRLLVRSTWNFLRIRKIVERFQRNFHEHYDRWSQLDFRSMPPHQLMSLYHEMEDALLWKWKAPIINDFFVMIFYGTLKKLCGSWCGDKSGSLQNDLICGEGDIESTAPTRMLLQLASVAHDAPELRQLILSGPLETLPEQIRDDLRFTEFNDLMMRYLDLYGFRCADELKLEEFSLWDRPHKVYQVIRSYLTLDNPAALDVHSIEAREQSIRRRAEQQALTAIEQSGGSWYRKRIFQQVLKNARLGVKNRENMRFSRTRIYGLFREMLRAVGGHLAKEKILDDREDIFFLTIDEVWDYVKGTAVTADLRGLAQLRRREFEGYRTSAPVPDDRFETYGLAYHQNEFRSHTTSTQNANGVLRGTGCCAGVVTGKVKVFLSPDDHELSVGDILVAERTDPGWIPLYPAAAGLLIGRGSVLSHSAVVAREMGIPTIVGISGLVDHLTTGQTVKMDGRNGTVKIVSDGAR